MLASFGVTLAALIVIVWVFFVRGVLQVGSTEGADTAKSVAETDERKTDGQAAQKQKPAHAQATKPEVRQRGMSDRARQTDRPASLEIVTRIYGPLLNKLKVSPDARKRFLELVCDERQAAVDVVTTANSQDLSYLTDPQVERMSIEAATSTDDAIRELLTPDDFDRFIDYRNSYAIHVSVSRVMDSIAEGGSAPLTNAQIQALIKVFFNAQTPGQLRRAPVNAVLNLSGAGITQEMVNSARAVLSDQQLAALIAVRAAQVAPRHDILGAPPQPPSPH